MYGNLVSHIISGYEKIVRSALELGVDPDKDISILMLSHIILSHHEKMEFGSPVKPGILEALIVARADALDASFEAADATLDNIMLYEQTQSIMSLDNQKLFKWHN